MFLKFATSLIFLKSIRSEVLRATLLNIHVLQDKNQYPLANNYRHLGGAYCFPLQGSPNITRRAEKLLSEDTKNFAIGVGTNWEMWPSVFYKVLGRTRRKLMVLNWRVLETEKYVHTSKYCVRAGPSSWTTMKKVLADSSGKSVIIYQLTWRHISKD